VEDWEPPEQVGETAECLVGSDSEEGVGCAPLTEEKQALSTPEPAAEPALPPEDPSRKETADMAIRDARRLLRATKKICYDLLREKQRSGKSEENPDPKQRVYVTLLDGVGIEHLRHRIGRREVYNIDPSKGWNKFRKALVRRFRLKNLQWNLWVKDNVAWICLPKVPHVTDGDELRLQVYGTRNRHPNAPGSSKRRHFDRPNSKRSRRDFIWVPSTQTQLHDMATTAKLAPPGQVGYRELPGRTLQEEEQYEREKQAQALANLQTRAKELRRDQNERRKMPPAPNPTPVTVPEIQRMKREVKTLEIMQCEKNRLDDRDEQRRLREESRKPIQAPPHSEKHADRVEREAKAEEEKQRKAAELETFRKQMEDQRAAKAKRIEEKRAEGKAKQAKAEARTKKLGWETS
jgi:hypothetical protein